MSTVAQQRGSAVVMSMLVVTVLILLGTGFLTVALTESAIASNEVGSARAFNLAEAGVEHARKRLETANVGTILSGDGILIPQQDLGAGSYTVTIRNNAGDSAGPTVDGDGILVVSSTGTYRAAVRTVETLVKSENQPWIGWTVFATGSFSAHGDGHIIGSAGANGNVVLNTLVEGDFESHRDVDRPWNVTGTLTEGVPKKTFQTFACPTGAYGPSPLGPGVSFNPLYGNVTMTGAADTWLPGGTYYFNNFEKDGAGQIVVNAGDFVEIYVKGDLEIEGGGFVNMSGAANNLRIYSCGPVGTLGGSFASWRLRPLNSTEAVIYAPNNELRFLSLFDFTGAMVVKNFFQQSQGDMIYDGTLPDGGGGAYHTIEGSWMESKP